METVNANAEYIYFKNGYQNKPTLIDMYDIKDIQFVGKGYIGQPQTNFMDYYDTNKQVDIYKVIYNDNFIWQIPIEKDALDRWNEFKTKHPVAKTEN